jgi:hypothetical protein
VATRGRQLTAPQAQPRQSAPNRTCAFVGCDTILSRFNEDPYCWVHRWAASSPHLERRVGSEPPTPPSPPSPSSELNGRRGPRPWTQEREARILNALACGPMTRRELEVALGVTPAQMVTSLHLLRAEGRVVLVDGHSPHARWRLAPPGEPGPTHQ